MDGEVVGDGETAWGDGERFTERGSWAMYFRYDWCDGDNGDGLETAFAFGGVYATCFLDIEAEGITANRWGWTNGALSASADPYTFDIYAGAGQCDTSKGTLVGTLTINYDGSTATVTYNTNSPYYMTETHLYVGSEVLARDVNGEYTVAPGQYPTIHEFDDPYPNSATYTITGLSGNIYVVAHAVVGPF